MQEYKILNDFPHPSLVKVHEFGLLDEGWSYLIWDLLRVNPQPFVRSLYGKERLYKCIQIATGVRSLRLSSSNGLDSRRYKIQQHPS